MPFTTDMRLPDKLIAGAELEFPVLGNCMIGSINLEAIRILGNQGQSSPLGLQMAGRLQEFSPLITDDEISML